MMVFIPEFYGDFDKLFDKFICSKTNRHPCGFKLMIKSFAMVSILLNTQDIPHIEFCLLQVNLTSG
jgi:hypothetical protein